MPKLIELRYLLIDEEFTSNGKECTLIDRTTGTAKVLISGRREEWSLGTVVSIAGGSGIANEPLKAPKNAPSPLVESVDSGGILGAKKHSDFVKIISGETRIFNFPISKILLWMGRKGWSIEQARKVLNALEVEFSSVESWLNRGRKKSSLIPAELSEDQEKYLEALL